MNISLKLTALATTLFLAGCCCHPKQKPTTQVAQTDYPVIVHLVSRHHKITITAGPHEPFYSVTDSTGRLLIANATLDEVATQQPSIYRVLEPLMATQSDDGRKPRNSKAPTPIALDASVAR